MGSAKSSYVVFGREIKERQITTTRKNSTYPTINYILFFSSGLSLDDAIRDGEAEGKKRAKIFKFVIFTKEVKINVAWN